MRYFLAVLAIIACSSTAIAEDKKNMPDPSIVVPKVKRVVCTTHENFEKMIKHDKLTEVMTGKDPVREVPFTLYSKKIIGDDETITLIVLAERVTEKRTCITHTGTVDSFYKSKKAKKSRAIEEIDPNKQYSQWQDV